MHGQHAYERLAHWLKIAQVNSPLIRLRHLLPPQKTRGEKALDWGLERKNSRKV